MPKNYEVSESEKLRLYIMISESSIAKQVYRDLESNKEQIDQVGIEYIIKTYIDKMAYYKTFDFNR
jgi:hypothetical protein